MQVIIFILMSFNISSQDLFTKKSGVPGYPFAKIRRTGKVPKLRLPEEKVLSLPSPIAYSSKKPLRLQTQNTPELVPLNTKELPKWKKLTIPNRSEKKTGVKLPEQIHPQFLPMENLALAPFTPFSDEQITLLRALIRLDQGKDLELALGQVLTLSTKDPSNENFLYYSAILSKKLGMKLEAKDRLLKLIKSSQPELKKKAISEALKLISVNDSQVKQLDAANNPNVDLVKTLRSHFQNEPQLSERTSTEVLVLDALKSYKDGDIQAASQILEKVADHPDAKLLKARIHVINKEYPQAMRLYKQMPNTHRQWLDSLIELGWVQLLSRDYKGAIGNMLSLNTPLFSKALLLEKDLIKTVGYLNLCQFGDAMRSAKDLKEKHVNVLETVRDFDQLGLYKEALRYLNSKTLSGLKSSVLLELTRSPDFIAIQRQINEIENEFQSYLTVHQQLLRGEKQALGSLKKEFREARKSISKIRKAKFYQRKAAKEALIASASEVLRTNLMSLRARVQKNIDDIDVLVFEIYEKSGTEIRSALAGVQPTKKEKRNLAGNTDMNWNFQGEIWIDEIGKYRSGLKNLCTN